MLSIEQIEDIAKLPARNVLDGQLVGVLASPITGLVRGLNGLIGGLAIQLGAIAEQGLVSGEAPAPAAEEAPAEQASGDDAPAENQEDSEAPSEGDTEANSAQPAEPAASPTTEEG